MEISVKYLPFAIVALLSVTLCVTSYLTISQGHVSGSAPYISDTGTLPPESCIFGQALNLLWVMISYAMYIKFRQISYLLNTYNMEQYATMNKSTFIIGLLAAFGSSIVANFQETNMFFIHWVGAVMVFGCGSVYQCMQSSGLAVQLLRKHSAEESQMFNCLAQRKRK
ncbi:DNA damage-regulated autophagy modulator protein 2-like [Anoplophora glabripennis]|uniref:DNA damage-regulated autophagy modulator protein 2-like n=1 Tax=Anoplophora glabripennis TaxID=217634 RepID=UPI000874E112|nr:DNA damage-regulated autophagy modulator protein 2-like [Anoplophora glabripennis]